MTNIEKTLVNMAEQVGKDISLLATAKSFDDNVQEAALRAIALTAMVVTGVLTAITFSGAVVSILTLNPLGVIPFGVCLACFLGSAFAFYKLQPPKTYFEKGVDAVENFVKDPKKAVVEFSAKAEKKIDAFVKDPEVEIGKVVKKAEKKFDAFVENPDREIKKLGAGMRREFNAFLHAIGA